MRTLVVLAVVGAAVAMPAAAEPPRATWADWVGSYHGKLAWSASCTAPGNAQATLALDATDGVLAIDLAPAGAALRAMTLVGDDTGWSGRQADVEVQLVRPRANQLALRVAFDSGCTLTAQLARATTGVPACDALVAWGAVEARCTKQSQKLEEASKLVATKWKAADAPRCTARADKLAHALVDAGCAPHPDPLIGVRARDCLDLVAAADKLARCGTAPTELTNTLAQEAHGLAAAAQTAEKATLPYVERQCRDARTMVSTVATRYRCQL
jgi:hypothetical protein